MQGTQHSPKLPVQDYPICLLPVLVSVYAWLENCSAGVLITDDFPCCTGCVLKADKREHKVEVDDDEVDHQLSLKAVFITV